jgi:hypothetical protein
MTRAIGPFADLFGGGDQRDKSQSLDVRGSLFGTYDGAVVTGIDPAEVKALGLAQSGAVGGVDGTLAYGRNAARAQFGLNGGGSFQRYAASAFGGATFFADTHLNVNLTRKVVLGTNAGVNHSPFYQFTPGLPQDTLGTVPLTPGYGVAAVAQPNTSFDGALSLTDSFSKRSTIAADVRWNETRFSGGQTGVTTSPAFREWGANLTFTHHISRPLNFHLGYGRDQVRTGGPEQSPVLQSIDIGVDYGDTLSFARRVTLSFSSSTAIVKFAGATNYRVDGTAMLARGFARTWSASVEYVRGIQFIPGFGQPLLSDAVTTTVGGLIAPRMSWTANAGYSLGEVGFDGTNSFGVLSASSTLETAVTRVLGVFVQYSYYRYKAPIGTSAIPLLPLFSRHAATVGLSAWLPIIKPRVTP